ncbi:MAG: hypothetical protein U9N79_01640 [Actinomycetota bacterium]|nr:hypothetical protein [Actinomycetota bacterium]
MVGGNHRAFVLLFAICLFAAACGSGEGGDAAGPLSEAETLEEFFGWGDDDTEAQKAEEETRKQREREMQEKIAECMAEQGFEYKPIIWEEEFGFVGPGEDEDLTQQEEKLKYGYHMFTMLIEDMQRWEENPPEEEFHDPNEEYLETLSESESEAYEKALWGDWEGNEPEPEFDEEGNEIWVEPDWSEIGGCQNIVEQEYRGDQNEAMEELWEELEPAWREFEQWINTDSRVVELNQAWSTCMAEKGYDFENEQAIHEYLGGLEEDLWTQNEPPPDWEPTEEEIEDMGPFGPGITEADVQALADEELAIAAADVECAGGMYEEIDEIAKGYEGKFIEKYRDLLERERELMQDF